MKPETAPFLAKARQFPAKAESMLAAGWPDEAGRAAYLAAFQAAQALIFERRDDVPRRHAGVHAVFDTVLRAEPRFDVTLRPFLRRAYVLKTRADYDTEPGMPVTSATATEALTEARRFVAAVAALIEPDGDHPSGA
ncbi:MAG: HEPN domain-containing protein [Acetobacteraceae bacterium]|nr:HEPN domain-containing protein [Acetobacteraceae bacterium]